MSSAVMDLTQVQIAAHSTHGGEGLPRLRGSEGQTHPVCGAGGAVTGWITLADLSRKLLIDSGTLQAALHDLTEIA